MRNGVGRMTLAFDLFWKMASSDRFEHEFPVFLREFGGRAYKVRGHGQPTHYTTGAGGHYSLRPDLTTGTAAQIAAGYVAKAAAGPGITAAPFTVLAVANYDMIDKQPEEEQRGFWQMFTSALSGSSWNVSGAGLI